MTDLNVQFYTVLVITYTSVPVPTWYQSPNHSPIHPHAHIHTRIQPPGASGFSILPTWASTVRTKPVTLWTQADRSTIAPQSSHKQSEMYFVFPEWSWRVKPLIYLCRQKMTISANKKIYFFHGCKSLIQHFPSRSKKQTGKRQSREFSRSV